VVCDQRSACHSFRAPCPVGPLGLTNMFSTLRVRAARGSRAQPARSTSSRLSPCRETGPVAADNLAHPNLKPRSARSASRHGVGLSTTAGSRRVLPAHHQRHSTSGSSLCGGSQPPARNIGEVKAWLELSARRCCSTARLPETCSQRRRGRGRTHQSGAPTAEWRELPRTQFRDRGYPIGRLFGPKLLDRAASALPSDVPLLQAANGV